MLITNATIVTRGSRLSPRPNHASPNAIDGSLATIAEAVEKSGLRAVLRYEVTNRDGPAKADARIVENRRFTTLDEAQIAARARELSCPACKRDEETVKP